MILKYKLKKGDISKYTTTVFSIRESREGSYYEKLESKMLMTITQKVIDCINDRDMLLRISIDSSSFWKDGKEVILQKKDKIYNIKMRDNGEVIESSGTGPLSPSSFPSEDVKPGSTWNISKEVSIPSPEKFVNLKTFYNLQSLENFNKFDCVKIVINTEDVKLNFEQDVSQVIGGNGFTYFAYNEGKLVKSEVNTFTITSLLDAEIKVTTKVIVDYLANGTSIKPHGDEFLVSL